MFRVRVEPQSDCHPQFLTFQEIGSCLPLKFTVDQLAELSRVFAQFIAPFGPLVRYRIYEDSCCYSVT